MQVQGDGEVRPVSWNDVMRLGRAAGPDHGQPVHPRLVLLRARGGAGHWRIAAVVAVVVEDVCLAMTR